RFFLWGNAVIQQLFFAADEPGQVLVQPGRAPDYPEIHALFSRSSGQVLPPEVDVARVQSLKADAEFLAAIVPHPGTRLRVARDQDGSLLGFGTVLTVCRDTVP